MSAIVWKKGTSNWYIESGCRNYTVSKAMVDSKAVYCAWHKSTALNVVDDPDEAKARCQKHKDTGR
jgi:hypothetical protein